MTRNQILKSQLYETAAHNRAMESIAAGELDERRRANRASESNTAEYNRIKAQRYSVQNAVDQQNADTAQDRVEYEHMDRMKTLEQRRKEWAEQINQFYSDLSFKYEKMESDNALRADDIATKIYRNDLEKNKVKVGGFSSMGRMAIDGLKIFAPIAAGYFAGPAAGGAAAVAAKLFK